MRVITLFLWLGIILTGCSEESEAPASGGSETEAVGASPLTLVWELGGLNNPESAVYDPASGTLFVSNVNGAAVAFDGNGYLSQLSLDGALLAQHWLTGLNAPKGMAIDGGTLYVADIDTLVAVDLATATVSASYLVEDAKFLNDVAVGDDGAVYVSDMMLDRIHRLHNGEFQIWLESPSLESPNGLLVEGDRLILGSWGSMVEGFSTEVAGHLKAISLVDQSITSLGSGEPVGNLDGVESDGMGGYYVTDWVAGKLYQFTPAGVPMLRLELEQGMADHEVLVNRRLIVLPMMKGDKVLAYQFGEENQ